jgi:hypothetical protein
VSEVQQPKKFGPQIEIQSKNAGPSRAIRAGPVHRTLVSCAFWPKSRANAKGLVTDLGEGGEAICAPPSFFGVENHE